MDGWTLEGGWKSDVTPGCVFPSPLPLALVPIARYPLISLLSVTLQPPLLLCSAPPPHSSFSVCRTLCDVSSTIETIQYPDDINTVTKKIRMPKVKKIIQPPDVQQSLGGHQQAGSFLGIEAVELPRAVVMKLAKSTGPDNMKLAKEVPVALTKASTVFINYLVAMAHDIAAERSEKSLNARHVLEACEDLDWADADELQRALKIELEAFRKMNAAKKVQKTTRSEPNELNEPNKISNTKHENKIGLISRDEQNNEESDQELLPDDDLDDEHDDPDDDDDDDEMNIDDSFHINNGDSLTPGLSDEEDLGRQSTLSQLHGDKS